MDQLEQENTEVISVSDTNLDLSLDFNKPNQMEFHERKLIPLYRILNEFFLNLGASVIQTKPTKIHLKKQYSFIDHLITNKPENIINSQVIFNGYGDHLIQKFTRTNKQQVKFPAFRIVRDYKVVNWYQLRVEIRNDPLYISSQLDKDPDTIATALIQSINNNLDNQIK